MVTRGKGVLKRPATAFRSAPRMAGTVAIVGGAGVGAGALPGSAVRVGPATTGAFTFTAGLTFGAGLANGVSVATCARVRAYVGPPCMEPICIRRAAA